MKECKMMIIYRMCSVAVLQGLVRSNLQEAPTSRQVLFGNESLCWSFLRSMGNVRYGPFTPVACLSGPDFAKVAICASLTLKPVAAFPGSTEQT